MTQTCIIIVMIIHSCTPGKYRKLVGTVDHRVLHNLVILKGPVVVFNQALLYLRHYYRHELKDFCYYVGPSGLKSKIHVQ